ncbi:sugar ABC transporter permease [Paenibacillus sp. YN15]|uniref:ABC transporter permease n=1 Tax=Paenibacillus sp. YN15 TaxID=1742774 RepID=UPI00215D398E|nr:ABC transporter permease subunit [Paenibacillus sp. YN15]
MATKAASVSLNNQAGLSKRRGRFRRALSAYHALYIMLIPGLLFFAVFKYFPMAGSVIAFKDYNIFKGFWDSSWVGWHWFEMFFQAPNIRRVLWNTVVLSSYQILFAFPAPIILALMLNELRLMHMKRIVQTILYLPHFLSWSIIFGLAVMMLSPGTGMVNGWIQAAGGEPVAFLQKAAYFRTLIVGTGIWKEMGWSAIIFIAALAGINPSLYEAAKMDGAGRWALMRHISIPGMLPAIVILLLLKIGNILDLGFEHIWVFLNPLTLSVGDVLDTYIYREGVTQFKYSLATSVGLFKSVIGLALILTANKISNRISGEGLF